MRLSTLQGFVVLLLSYSVAIAEPTRSWTANGFTEEGVFVSLKDGIVTLRMVDGQLSEVAFASLSRDDQRYVESVQERVNSPFRRKAAPPGGASLEETVTNSLGIQLRLIPAGSFMMGDARERTEPPARPHKVTLTRPYYIGTHEITNTQWLRVMGKGQFEKTADDRPVDDVFWKEAVKFCEKLSKLPEEVRAGRSYRLPTEAEWEYACRAGSPDRFCSGDEETGLDECAWYHKNSAGKTHPVGGKKPNRWGLHDMHGNAFEWCSDWLADYPSNDVIDPQGPANGRKRVLRGGDEGFLADYCTSAFRTGFEPDGGIAGRVGLRVVMDAPGVAQQPRQTVKGNSDALPAKLLDIQQLTLEQAAAVVEVNKYGATLYLDGLLELSPEVAELLATTRCQLSFKSLRVLLPDAAAALAGSRAGWLYVDGPTSLSPDAAKALAQHRHQLTLNGIKELPAGVAEHLGKHKGTSLELNGLVRLSDEDAAWLGNYKGQLSLSRIDRLTDEQARSLAKCGGQLILAGVTAISDAQAQSLARHHGGLTLSGLLSLNDAQAESLANTPDRLDLGGLTSLSLNQAKSLADYEGDSLSLYGLKTLPDAQAISFASYHGGSLSLSCLSEISQNADAALRANPRISLPQR